MSNTFESRDRSTGGGLSPIPANTALGNFTNAVALPTAQSKSSWLSWLDAATNTALTSLGGTVASIGSNLLTLAEIVDTKVANDDSRLTNAREWIAATVDQAEAELGIGTDRRAWTALRVRQSARVNPDFDPTGNIFTIGTTTNAQRLRLRRRFAGAGDFSQLSIDFSGDNCRIQTQQAGNTPNPLVLGTAGVDRVFLSATSTQLGIGGSPTTRPLEIFAGTAGFRLQSSSAVSPPVYSEIARTFDFLTWQDSTSPFNTCTDLIANSNQFNNHSLRVFVHTSGVSDPVLHSVFHSSGRLLVGTDVDNGTDRVQVNGPARVSGILTTTNVVDIFPNAGANTSIQLSASSSVPRMQGTISGNYRGEVGIGNTNSYIANNNGPIKARGTGFESRNFADTANAPITGSDFSASGFLDVTGTTFCNGSGGIRLTTRVYLQSPSDGVLTLTNNAFSNFTRLNFGPATSAFPAIRRNGTTAEIRLADDSSFAPLACSSLTASGNATINGADQVLTLSSSTSFSLVRCSIASAPTQFMEFGRGGSRFQVACQGNIELEFQTNNTRRMAIAGTGEVSILSHVTSAFQSLSTDPSTIDIGTGLHRVVKNTTSGEVRDWVNDGGVMKKSPAYT